MGFVLEDVDSYLRALDRAISLVQTGEFETAVMLAERGVAAPELQPQLAQLRAFVLTESARRLRSVEMAERGLGYWREFGAAIENSGTIYNTANAELTVFELKMRQSNRLEAMIDHREHLHAARMLYELVSTDTTVDAETRLQALTNCGNAFDLYGRSLEALAKYDLAIALDPTFGMARGNRAITLAAYASSMRDHQPTMYRLAASDLDIALNDEERILRFSGSGALQNFRAWRVRLTETTAHAVIGTSPAAWEDPYLRWCFENTLYLHVSCTCLHPDDARLDPLFPRGVSTGPSDAEKQRMGDVVDAFNALKQDYVSARYLTWLATDAESASGHAQAVSARTSFHDTYSAARWGVRTGLLLQALTAATNLLDKIAAFLHLYFRTGRRRQEVYFRGFWRATRRGGQPSAFDPAFEAELEGREGNAGLLALCDLACDLEQDTLLGRLLALRHAATHRFLVAHHDLAPESSEWLERLEIQELVTVVYDQLRVARAAYVYLVRAVDIHEMRVARADKAQEGLRLTLPLEEMRPDRAEIG